jgi:hypothetical protein
MQRFETVLSIDVPFPGFRMNIHLCIAKTMPIKFPSFKGYRSLPCVANKGHMSSAVEQHVEALQVKADKSS